MFHAFNCIYSFKIPYNNLCVCLSDFKWSVASNGSTSSHRTIQAEKWKTKDAHKLRLCEMFVRVCVAICVEEIPASKQLQNCALIENKWCARISNISSCNDLTSSQWIMAHCVSQRI